jgi:hypothetical protein
MISSMASDHIQSHLIVTNTGYKPHVCHAGLDRFFCSVSTFYVFVVQLTECMQLMDMCMIQMDRAKFYVTVIMVIINLYKAIVHNSHPCEHGAKMKLSLTKPSTVAL